MEIRKRITGLEFDFRMFRYIKRDITRFKRIKYKIRRRTDKDEQLKRIWNKSLMILSKWSESTRRENF